MERKVNVIEDIDGKKTVFIHDIIFKGKRSVKWEDVEKYLKQYVGDIYTIDDSNDAVYIGTDLPEVLFSLLPNPEPYGTEYHNSR